MPPALSLDTTLFFRKEKNFAKVCEPISYRKGLPMLGQVYQCSGSIPLNLDRFTEKKKEPLSVFYTFCKLKRTTSKMIKNWLNGWLHISFMIKKQQKKNYYHFVIGHQPTYVRETLLIEFKMKLPTDYVPRLSV